MATRRLSGIIAVGEPQLHRRNKEAQHHHRPKREEREIVRRAVVRSDVLLHNYRPASRSEWASLQTASAGSAVDHGEHASERRAYAGKAGFDRLAGDDRIMARGRLRPARSIVTTTVTDISSGMFMACGASALYQRERTGRGQRIESSLFAAGVAIQYRPMLSIESADREARVALLRDLEEGRREGKTYEEILGERRPGRAAGASGPYYRTYEARDGYMVIACLNNRLRRAVRDVVGVDDPRVDGEEFAVLSLDAARAQQITAEIEGVIATKTVAEWCAIFDAKGVPCGPVRLPAEMFEDAHVVANNLVVELDHPVVGKIKMANSPLKMSGAETGAGTSPRPRPAHA
jgi:crotonobetainyl-CoA:carnitine CoA-transferase CaiB-like acyl-CoA transferase